MESTNGPERKPLWLEIEEGIQGLDESEVSAASTEAAVRKLAGQLDEKGFNASRTGGHLLHIRYALEARRGVGRSLMADLTGALDGLTLEDVAVPYTAGLGVVRKLQESWPALKGAEQIGDVLRMVEDTRLKLLIQKAAGMEGGKGIRYLRHEAVAPADILQGLGITEDQLKAADEAMAAEAAERERVQGLLEKVADKDEEERIKHLLNSDVAEDLIVEIAGVDQGAIDAAKKAMEEEIREKERLAAEAAARKKAEAEGPALEDIEPDDMLEHIEALREIMEFSDVEKEIRTMGEQSGIPKALMDLVIADPEKLDELEEKAEAES